MAGEPLVINGFPAGRHKVVIQVVDANHPPLDRTSVEFTVPTVKKRVWLAKGYGSFPSAWRTLQGIETMHMITKDESGG